MLVYYWSNHHFDTPETSAVDLQEIIELIMKKAYLRRIRDIHSGSPVTCLRTFAMKHKVLEKRIC